jgi:predicted TIM-barrel fold metal-dependent hydrolase
VGMAVVDAHVHIFPDDIVQHRERYIARDDWFAQLYSPPKARLATMHDLVESMDGAGIDYSIACGFPWFDQGLCRYHNDYMCEAARIYPDRIGWLAIVSPTAGDAAARSLEDAFGDGACGLGELNADAQGFDLSEPKQLAEVVEVCQVRQKPAMFHVSEPIGHDYPGKGTSTPTKLLRFLEAYPDLTVVAAHWGGGMPFYELMPEVRTAAVNLAYDSAASTYLYDHKVFETVAELVGSDRVLFASDFPVLKQGPILRKIRERPGLSEFALTSILGENAIRIYGLEGSIA